MGRETQIGVDIEARDNTSQAFVQASAGAKKTEGAFTGIGKAVKSMPEQFGKASAAMLVMQNSTSQMGGKIADVGNKVTGVASLLMTGGPMGVALAAAAALTMAASVAWDAYSAETRHAEAAQRSLEVAMQKLNDRMTAQTAGVEKLKKEYADFGKTTAQITIDDLKKEIEMRERSLKVLLKERKQSRYNFEASKEERQAAVEEGFLQNERIKISMKGLDTARAQLAALEDLAEMEKGKAALAQDAIEIAAEEQAAKEKKIATMKSEIDVLLELAQAEMKMQNATLEQWRQTEGDKIDLWLANQNLKRRVMDENMEREIRAAKKTEEANKVLAEATTQTWTSAMSLMSGVIENHIVAMIDGTETARDAMLGMLADILRAVMAQALTTLVAHAAAAAVEAGSAVASVPYIGPFLALTAASTTLSALMAYKDKIKPQGMALGGLAYPQGGYDNTLIAMNPHKERVLDEHEAKEWQRFKRTGEGGQGGQIVVQAMFPNGATESKQYTERYVDNVLIPALLKSKQRGKLQKLLRS